MSKLSINKIWKSNLFLLGANLLAPLSGILLLPLYLNHFAPSEYGTLALMRTISAFTAILGTLSLRSAVMTFYFDYSKEEFQKYLSQIFSTALFVAIVYTTLALLFGPSIFDWVFKSESLSFFPLGILAILNAIVMGLLTIFFVYLKNDKQIIYFVRLAFFGFVCSVMSQYLLVDYFDWGVTGALSGSLISYGLILLYLILKQDLKITFQLEEKYWKKSVKYSLGIIPFLFANWGLFRADRIIVEQYLTLTEVGQYALAFNLAFLTSYVAGAFLDAIRPELKVELNKLLLNQKNNWLKFFALFLGLIILAACFIFAGSFLLPYLSDHPKYAEVTQFLPWVLLLTLIQSITRFFNQFFFLWQRNTEIMIAAFINLAIFLIYCLYLNQMPSLLSVIYTLIFSNTIALVLTLGFLWRLLQRRNY